MTDDKPDVDGTRFETPADAVRYAMDQGGGTVQYVACETGGEDRRWCPDRDGRAIPVLIEGQPMVITESTHNALHHVGVVWILHRAEHPDGRVVIAAIDGHGNKGPAWLQR